jgi:transposase-like protein
MLRTELRKEWVARIADYTRSGLTAREWCARQGITESQLKYWLRQVRKSEQKVEWASVRVVEDEAPDRGVSVHLGAARIEVRPGFDATLLGEVLRVVASTC